MTIKKSLSRLIILAMLFTGCSNYQVRNEGISLPNEATKQKTMTKVQNDVNEIIGKKYDYVLSNLGEPNSIEYWIDKINIDNLKSLDDIKDISDINLVYLKSVLNEDENSSALYLQLKDKVVKKAQIVDNSRGSIIKNSDKSKILIDYYNDGDTVKTVDLEIKKLDNFIGMDFSEIEKIVGNNQPSYDAYLYDKVEKSVNIYYLDNEDKLLSIFTKDNKISEIKIFENEKELISEIKNIMLDN